MYIFIYAYFTYLLATILAIIYLYGSICVVNFDGQLHYGVYITYFYNMLTYLVNTILL